MKLLKLKVFGIHVGGVELTSAGDLKADKNIQ
jgi:hypothetical protein